jgi:histone H2A
MSDAAIAPVPRVVVGVLRHIGYGAAVLFASSHCADELALKHDTSSWGERILVSKLLHTSHSVLGSRRNWFDQEAFDELVAQGRCSDVVAVLDAMDNLDIGAWSCYVESVGEFGDEEEDGWAEFDSWRQDARCAADHCVRMLMWKAVIQLKLYAIRFRKRAYAPRGAMAVSCAGRFKPLAKKKKQSKSAKAGLTFPAGRIRKYLRNRDLANRLGKTGPVFLASVLEYLVAEVLELAGNACRDNKKKRITPRHITLAVRNDEELAKLLGRVTIVSGGVLPNIHAVLLPKKKKPKNAERDKSLYDRAEAAGLEFTGR